MRLGVTFPQSDLALDAGATREFAQAVEEMGFDHLLFYEHVVGAGRTTRPDWSYIHDEHDRFHEVFVVLGYIAALTESIELVPGVLCLPQRQTALVAKQAAELDHLCGGRFRLGVGVGWNFVVFGALGADFHTRGRRIQELIEVLRLLWTSPTVTYEGEFHSLPDVGINPLPLQRPIPIWYGSGAERILERVARLADGWIPEPKDPEELAPQLEKLRGLIEREGRNPDEFGLQGRLSLRHGGPDMWREHYQWFLENGFTHYAIATIWSGAKTLGEHLELLQRYCDEVGVLQ
jgi:probable F420-dependent oxidoreductase